MFKKAVEAKSHQRLSGADKKKLKRTVREKFPRASDTEIDALLPPKVEITVAKFQNRVQVYGVEGGYPMFFDVDGRGTEVYPTVFALWTVPGLLPSFMLKGGEVSRYIVGGADLMFPGISVPAEGLPSFLAGETWAVTVPGNPAPIAVGSTTMSCTEAMKAGLRGKALRITHYYRDFLWESVEGFCVPNAGFLEDAVFLDPAMLSYGQDSNSCEDAIDASDDPQSDPKDGVDESAGSDGVPKPNTASTINIGGKNDTSEQLVTDVGDLKLADDFASNQSSVEEQHALSTEDVDACMKNCLMQALHTTVKDKDLPMPGSTLCVEEQHALSTEDVDACMKNCLMQALHTTVKDKDLPMPGSTLWSNHVLPNRPSGVTLDIKKSTHKKLSKWLQANASAGLISVKEDKHKKEMVLFSVNRNHPDYMAYKPEKRKAEKCDQTVDQPASVSRSQNMVELAEIYKPSVHVNRIFASVGADTGKLFSALEASEVVFKYIEQENLVRVTDKSTVVLDPILCDALFKGAIKKGSAYPTTIHKKDLASTFISRMQANHVVTRGSDSVIRKGGVKTIQIMTERRQGNKKMTKVSGLETFLIDPESMASELQKKFACSTTVAELPGKKGLEVLIQGSVIDDVAKHLVEHYGVPKRYIEVLDKTRR